MNEFNDFYQNEKNEKVFCESCYNTQDHKIRKNYTFVQGEIFDYGNVDTTELKNKVKDNELKKLVDDYYQLDFEDVIAGGLKTRFKYVNVNSEDYGLNDETLIYADDKLLNQLVGIKKLAPYREDQGIVKESKLRKKWDFIEKNAKINKRIFKNELK